jgi:hypothetical protein
VHAIGVPEEVHERSPSLLEEVISTGGTPAIKSFERLEKAACEVQGPSLDARVAGGMYCTLYMEKVKP